MLLSYPVHALATASQRAASFNDRLLMGALGLGDESSEAIFSITIGVSRHEILLELGDILWYTAYLCQTLNLMWGRMITEVEETPFARESGKGIVFWSGQIQGHVKKFIYHGHELESHRLQSHLLNLLRNLALLAKWYGSTLEEIASMNLAKLAQRFEEGKFSEERSRNRAA